MFEEIITGAAELLAEKQLGLDRKKDSDKGNLPEVLVSFRQIYENELTEQFLKVCATMKVKYEIRKLEPETLQAIAIGIKDVVEDAVKGGDTVSISSIFQNKEILAIAEKETIKQKQKEETKVEESIPKIQNEPQENKAIEQAKVDEVYNGFGELTDTNKKVLDLSKQMTKDNVAEIRKQISINVNSEEVKKENEEFYKQAEIVIQNGTEEQKRQTMEEVRRRKKIEKRRSMTPEERLEKRRFVNTNLFDLISLSTNSGFNKNIDFIKAEILAFVDEEVAFTDEEVLEITESINKTNELREIQTILAKKLISISKENGVIIKDESTLIESLINTAKNKTRTKIEKENTELNRTNSKKGLNYEEESKTIDKELSIKYANMYLGERDRARVMSLLDQIEDVDSNMSYDFSILDKIKNTNRDFYYSMIRHIGLVARDTKNQILTRTFDEIVEKEAKEQTIIQNKMSSINVRKNMSPEKQKETKAFLTGILYNFVAQNYHSEESLEIQKEELIKFLRKEHGFSEEEKLEFYKKIEAASSNEEFVDVMIDKMAELTKEKNGIILNKDKVREVAQKKPKISKMQIAKAKAKIVLDDQTFNQYIEFERELIKGISEDDSRDYDFDLVDLLKQRDSEIYENVKAYIKEISEKRKDDKKLKRLYDRLVTNDRNDNEFKLEWEKENEQKKSIIKNTVENKRKKREELPKNLNNSTTKTSIALFDLMTRIYDEKNETNEGLEHLKSEVFGYIANDMSFSDEETAELLEEVMNSTRNAELGKILAGKMVKLSEERGIPKGSLFDTQIIEMAKNRTRTMNLRQRENIGKANVLQSQVYAKMFLNINDRNALNKMLSYSSYAENSKKEMTFDFDVLDKIKDVNEAFYYTTIRALGVMAEKTGKPELTEKYNELLTNELMEKNYNDLDDFGKINVKARIVLDERIYNRYKDLENDVRNGSIDGEYDEELIKFLQEKEPNIYTTLMRQTKQIATTRKDVGLAKLVEKFMSQEEQDIGNEKKQTQDFDKVQEKKQVESEIDLSKETRSIDVGNIFVAPEVSEIVISHADSERLVRKEKNQPEDIVGEGR